MSCPECLMPEDRHKLDCQAGRRPFSFHRAARALARGETVELPEYLRPHVPPEDPQPGQCGWCGEPWIPPEEPACRTCGAFFVPGGLG